MDFLGRFTHLLMTPANLGDNWVLGCSEVRRVFWVRLRVHL